MRKDGKKQMTNLTYYARKQYKKDGVAGSNDRFGNREDMEYQYHLYCANSVKNQDGNDLCEVTWGTIEHGEIERKVWLKEEAQPEPEEEPGEEE